MLAFLVASASQDLLAFLHRVFRVLPLLVFQGLLRQVLPEHLHLAEMLVPEISL